MLIQITYTMSKTTDLYSVHGHFLITRLIGFLKNKRIPPLITSLSIGGTCLGTGFIIALVENQLDYLLTVGKIVYLSWMFLGPYLIWLSEEYFSNLWDYIKKTSKIPEKEYLDRRKKMYKIFYGNYYYAVGTIGGIIASIGFIFFHPGGLLTTFPLISYICIMTTVLSIHGCIGIFGITSSILSIYHMSKYDLRLSALSPERFGGLEFVENFSLRAAVFFSTGSFIFPLLIEALTTEYARRSMVNLAILGSSIYSIVVVLSFAIPVMLMNKAARRTKYDMIHKIKEQYDTYRFRFEKEKTEKNAVFLLFFLSEFRETREMRVYPWSLPTLVKIFLAALLPILSASLKSEILPWLASIFTP